jgi:hypothetical protein
MKVVATVQFDILVDMDETMFNAKEWTSSINGEKYINYETKEGKDKDVDDYIKDLQEKVSFKEEEPYHYNVIVGSGELMAIADLNGNPFYEM